MKLLIAYDGSHASNQICDDLEKAGLPPENIDVLVLSVAEVWMPPPQNGTGGSEDDYPDFINKMAQKRLEIAKNAVQEADTLSQHARKKLLAKFPHWNIKSESTNGSPGWEILERAKKMDADLIVVGAQGKNAFGRILMGSISQKVMTEAECSVRVVRSGSNNEDRPVRIMIAFDGSTGSIHAVNAVAARNWGKGARVCLLTATHSLLPITIGRFVPPLKEWLDEDQLPETVWIEKLMESSKHRLEQAGMEVESMIKEGSPKQVIVDEARNWNADSIFVGAHSYTSMLEKCLIGSTSAAIASRSQCTVETVRE